VHDPEYDLEDAEPARTEEFEDLELELPASGDEG